MKKYVFRLETVRRIRRTQEELARQDLLRANNEVQRAISAVEERTRDHEARLIDTRLGVTGVDAFMKRRYFNELSGQALIAAHKAQQLAEIEASSKRDSWSSAAKKVKILDRLDEKKREQYLTDLLHEEEREVDDIVTGQFRRSHR